MGPLALEIISVLPALCDVFGLSAKNGLIFAKNTYSTGDFWG
jgi:hypothetical protein